MLLVAVLLLWGIVRHLEATCPATGSHKAVPSPEPELYDCPLYLKNACCTVNIKDKVNTSPEAEPWNRCGHLSTKCEQFFKQLSCFYRCSPDATMWASPSHSNSLLNVPLCQGFCDQWYKACEHDQTCVRNWNTDLKWSNRTEGTCTSDCISFDKMYKDGKDLCQSTSGDSFKVKSCNCLNMDKHDEQVIKTLMQEDSTKAGINGELPCKEKRSTLNQLRLSIRKRSLFVEDVDGSGSGFPTNE
ncbi:retbindin [Scyliorhinus torazame]|uniref:retbindin n=1 Tax=Scyliorhinus torazame TaxID=75743 RepID=UPI003B59DBE2